MQGNGPFPVKTREPSKCPKEAKASLRYARQWLLTNQDRPIRIKRLVPAQRSSTYARLSG